MSMRIGVSLTSGYAVSDGRAGARFMIERAGAARRAGLDSLFVGDHHATPGPYYQNVPIVARCLAEWGDAPFGALFLLPLWNPVLVAEQVGTLATLAPGRFILQAGLGYDERQFAAMGAELRTRPSAFEESLDAVRRLLGGEVVSSSGRFKFRDARVAPRPPEPVEYWIGATAEPAIDRAARLGDGWLASPELPPDRARALIGYYRDRCRAHGRTPAAIAIRRDIYVGETDAEAERTAGARVRAGYRGFPPESPVYGSIDRVAAQFRALAAMGYTDVIIRHLLDDQAQVLASYARLAEVRKAVADA
jgi:alkanesulfonate monooxygenase SsuD/methylene tetrahydromethanopterin reductase-like flavin-dependent oxidoreductase (luciferase family)